MGHGRQTTSYKPVSCLRRATKKFSQQSYYSLWCSCSSPGRHQSSTSSIVAVCSKASITSPRGIVCQTIKQSGTLLLLGSSHLFFPFLFFLFHLFSFIVFFLPSYYFSISESANFLSSSFLSYIIIYNILLFWLVH